MIKPLSEIPIGPVIASLPKADLHLHQEEVARLERVVARQQGRRAHDWRRSAQRLICDIPFGESRLAGMYAHDDHLDFGVVQADSPEYIIAKIVDVLEESAADGSVLTEIRFGASAMAFVRPDFMTLFREAERQVQERYPQLRAEAIGYLGINNNPDRFFEAEEQFKRCLAAAKEGLGGIDFRTHPYDTEAPPALWSRIRKMAERAADAGLGITVHAGEFSAANLDAALNVPYLRRLGHAVYAATDKRLLERIGELGVTIECSLSCNVVLGAVATYEAHPIRHFWREGILVTLSTDNPVRIWTTIGREYAIASQLGFSLDDLQMMTRNAIAASFTSEERRKTLLMKIDTYRH